MTEVDHIDERIVAGQLLTAAGAAGTAVVDSFLTWSLAGAGAVLGLVVANIESLAPYIAVSAVKAASVVFLSGAALVLLTKILAAITQAAEKGRAAAAELVTQPRDWAAMDAPWLLNHITSAMVWPWRVIVKRRLADVQKGDFSAPGRLCMRVAQWHTNLAVPALALTFLSLAILGAGIQAHTPAAPAGSDSMAETQPLPANTPAKETPQPLPKND